VSLSPAVVTELEALAAGVLREIVSAIGKPRVQAILDAEMDAADLAADEAEAAKFGPADNSAENTTSPATPDAKKGA
jgi:hypothetical protein